LITDFHAHTFPDHLAPRAIEALNARIPPDAHAVLDGTVGGLLASMDRAGIQRSVVASIATKPQQVGAILRWSLSIRSDRIIPFGSVHPACESPAAEVEKIAEAGLCGIKLHPLYQDFTVDDPALWPLYEAIAGAGLVLLCHAGQDVAFRRGDDRAAPRRLLAVHEAFPGMPMVAAHLGGWRMWEQVAATLCGSDVYLETSYALGVGRDDVVLEVLRRHPVERIMFGTDSPWRSQKQSLDDLVAALAESARDAVLRTNAERLLGLVERGTR